MATTNPVLSPSWSQLVAAGDNFFFTLPDVFGLTVEIAVSDTAVAPTVVGHLLQADKSEGLTRELVGPGYLYGRTVRDSVAAILTAWTPA